jgi:adenine/guanine phosphoribosyltransferase-like PRPP-binding protein
MISYSNSHVVWVINVVECQVVCVKVREGDERIVRIKEGNPAGYHVVIVDDLVQSGGTLVECQVCIFQIISHLI